MELQDKEVLFFILLIMSVILTRLPYIGKFFRVINTMMHESGHALMALLTSARVLKVELFQNTGGTATTQSKSRISQILISLAGYPVSSATGFAFFYFINREQYFLILYVLLVVCMINLVFLVRNYYGIFWLIVFSTLLILILYFKTPFLLYSTTVFFSWVLLVDSLFSAFRLLIISIRNPSDSGDARNLKTFTLLPSFFWALLFFLQAGYFVYRALVLFYPAAKIL